VKNPPRSADAATKCLPGTCYRLGDTTGASATCIFCAGRQDLRDDRLDGLATGQRRWADRSPAAPSRSSSAVACSFSANLDPSRLAGRLSSQAWYPSWRSQAQASRRWFSSGGCTPPAE
jgi:hypothetical protein